MQERFTCIELTIFPLASSGFPSHEAFIEPVGAFFEALARRQRHNRTESEDDRAIALVEAAKAAEAVCFVLGVC